MLCLLPVLSARGLLPLPSRRSGAHTGRSGTADQCRSKPLGQAPPPCHLLNLACGPVLALPILP